MKGMLKRIVEMIKNRKEMSCWLGGEKVNNNLSV